MKRRPVFAMKTGLIFFAWTKTILDVRTENAEVYCEDIKAWAKSALEDVQGFEV